MLLKDFPKCVKPFVFHGADLSYSEGDTQARGDCLLCGKPGRFYVNVDNGKWDCKKCFKTGNTFGFLRELWQLSYDATYREHYDELAADRGLLSGTTPWAWQVARSYVDGVWVVPGYGPNGQMNQWYRYVKDHESGKMRLYATPGINHQIHGLNLWIDKRPDVIITEGPWDGMALWEILRSAKKGELGSYELTGNLDKSVGAYTNVVALPGASVFPDYWASLFSGKNVTLMYDNDHPRENPATKTLMPAGGLVASKKATAVLALAPEKPAKVSYLRWGEDGWTPNHPNGYDIRDLLKERSGEADRVKALGGLFASVTEVPPEWSPGRDPKAKPGTVGMTLCPCTDYRTMITAWRKSLKWSDGLDRALSVMLASVISTRGVGDQLWVRIISPPSTGKTTLAEALSQATKYVKAVSNLRGFYSGYRETKDEGEDNSLISQLYDKTMIMKDGDELLQSPNLKQILAEARGIYDRVGRTQFRNKSSKDYTGLNVTMILCGTNSLRTLDTSELGERFLDCKIMDKIDLDYERDVQWRVINRVIRNRAMESNGKPEGQMDPAMVAAYQLTGGYVEYLRENAIGLQEAVVFPDSAAEEVMNLARFVATMRARPSERQHESAEREFSARLTSQLGRLALCLAAVLNRTSVDAEVMRRVRLVALDTAQGQVLDMCNIMYTKGEAGAEAKELGALTTEPTERTYELLRFMRKIGVAELFARRNSLGIVGKPRYRMTAEWRRDYAAVLYPQAIAPENSDEIVIPEPTE